MIDFSKMNEAQRLAVTHGEGPLLLLAGPGSGKTFTITQRILYLLERGTPPERVLVITFTKDAAASMQRRFRQLSPVTLPVNFGTFHSVFYHMLKESGCVRTEHPLNQSRKKKILLPILKEVSEEAFKDLIQEDTAAILNAMSFYKNTLSMEKAAQKAPKEWQSAFPEILARYEAARGKLGAVDFDDMVCECRKMLAEQPRRRQYWQNRFDHILMDEFQDINPVQYETIKLLARPPYNFFAVGDDDQAIYGFRGAQPECLKNFQEDFNARQLLLNVNYRSCGEIIAASGKVIGENKNRFPKDLRPADRNGSPEAVRRLNPDGFPELVNSSSQRKISPVTVQCFPDRDSQYQYLLRRLAESPYRQSRAVLFRTNIMMQGVAARLRRAGIPYIMKEKVQSIYEHFIVRDITAYLLLAQGEWSRERFLYICNRPSRYISREAAAAGDSFQRIRAYYASVPKQRAALELLERQLRYIGRASLKAAVAYICKAVGYEQFLREQSKGHPDRWLEWQETLEWVRADAGRFETAKDWLAAREEYNESLKRSEKQADDSSSKEAVWLMTVHGSKGLEFDHVLIPDCNERVFPHGKMPDGEACEEERRIFYVAMTRAAKSLELLYLNDNTGSRLPSRFLNPLLKDC
ncbi:MAG: ATP-dependent helicase [Blautia sp.]|nr:ATP-dependent helicase [Blautia sp.]